MTLLQNPMLQNVSLVMVKLLYRPPLGVRHGGKNEGNELKNKGFCDVPLASDPVSAHFSAGFSKDTSSGTGE